MNSEGGETMKTVSANVAAGAALLALSMTLGYAYGLVLAKLIEVAK